MANEDTEQADKEQLSISSPQSVEEPAPFHLQTREDNGGIPLSVHNHSPGPWNTGNQLIQASSESMSGHNPIIGELTAQSNHSNEQISGRVFPLINAVPDPTNSRSTLSYSSNMASGSHRRLRNQAPYQAPILCPHQLWRAKQFSNPLSIQNVEGSSNPMLNIRSVPHQSLPMNRGVLNAAQFRATGRPTSSSMVGFGQPAFHGPNNLPITAIRNLSPRPVMAPARSIARHNWSGPVMVSSCSGVPGRMLTHVQPGQPVPNNAVSAVNASQGSSFPNIVRVQRAGRDILGQSQASVLNHWNNTHSHAHSSGRGIRPTNQGIRPVNMPQPTTHSGPSLKRGASNSAPIPPAQRRKTRSTIPSRPSVATWRPIAPRQPPPSVDSIDSLFSRLLQDFLHQSLLTFQSTNYIKWQEEETTCPSGFECPICKRDLSYKAEGPMYEPDELQSTSVLACGHYFHSSCLLRFTPADQAADPPCTCCLLDR